MEIEQESIFSQIYKNRTWGLGTADSPLSGRGSHPDVAKAYVDLVKRVIVEFKVASVLDVGHGDWAMWRDYKFENTSYLGVDVAENISEVNTLKYGNTQRRFVHVKASDPLPDASLLLCKDVLQHLSIKDIDQVLSQLSAFDYVILCNDMQVKISLKEKIKNYLQPRTRLKKIINFQSPFYIHKISGNNSDINTGEFRGLDLENSQFISKFQEFELFERIEYKFPDTDNLISKILFFRKIHN